MLMLGLRRAEALGLRWRDIDLDRGRLTVSCTLRRTKDGLQFLPPKTRTSRRSIALPTFLTDMLKRHKPPNATIDELVFPSSKGTPMDPNNVNRHFRKLLKECGIEPTRVHDMRHTAASLMRAHQIPDYMIARVLGHSSIRVTHDLYGHTYESDERQVAEKLEELWG